MRYSFSLSELLLTALLVTVTLSTAGCDNAPGERSLANNPAAMAYRSRVILAAEPQGVIELAEAKQVVGEQGDMNIAVIARIQRDQPHMAAEGRPVFSIHDNTVDDHGDADHNPNTCPFCKRRLAETLTVVEMAADSALPKEAESLPILGLAEGDEVVVRGKARLDETGALVIVADGIYPRN